MNEDRPDDRLQIVEEQLHVGKRLVESDHVSVRTVVDEREVVVEDSVERGMLDVQRVAMDVQVAVAPPPREEGDLIVISVVEERVVVEKRLFLVEELRVRRTSRIEDVSIPATVRTMRAVVERDPDPITTRRD